MDGIDGIDVFKLNCEGGRDRRSGGAETEGVSARQVKTGKKFARRRKDFTKPRCSEPRTGFTDACGFARFPAKSHGSEKSIPLAYEEGIDRRVSSGFWETEYYAKQRSRFSKTETRFAVFITKKQEDFINIRNEIKSQIVRAGFTMQEAVDLLHDEYGWSDSVSNLSAKSQRESIRYKEVVELADVLDCDIVWVKRGARR